MNNFNNDDDESLSSELLLKAESLNGNNDDIKRPSVLSSISSYIIVTEFFESLTYFGYAGSLVLFFQTRLKYSNAQADVQFSAWSGLCYLNSILGGYIADSLLGRYKTIIFFLVLYIIGSVLLIVAVAPLPPQYESSVVALTFVSIYLISFGTGGMKSSISTVGADQFDANYERDRIEKESYFNYFYWMINLGALISFTVVAYICQYGIHGLGGTQWSFFLGFMICLMSTAASIVTFTAGTKKYKLRKPDNSTLEISLKIMYEALWIKGGSSNHTSWLDKAKDENGGSFRSDVVDKLKNITKLVPFLLAMIPYWGIYGNTITITISTTISTIITITITITNY